MNSLFQSDPIKFDLPNADIVYYPRFIEETEANSIFRELLDKTPWQQDEIKIFGKIHPQPRLTALFGDEGKSYSYSNLTMQPHPWNSLLLQLKARIEEITQTQFTSVLLNLYRNGKDSNGWHADDEKELGKNPVIASLSFGAERVFGLRHNNGMFKQKITLENGSLLIRRGETQHFWKHQIAKTMKPSGARINLTFRTLIY